MKYIIGKFHEHDLERPVLFGENINHKDMAKTIEFLFIVSAGFVKYDADINGGRKMYAYGESFTLGICSRPIDIDIIMRELN